MATRYYKPLRNGNDKIDCLTFSLPPGKSCPTAKKYKCFSSGCYGTKGRLAMPASRKLYERNFEMAKHNLPALEALIVKQLKHSRKEAVRIHVVGDFFSQPYVDMWCRIARNVSQKRFFFYTKTAELFDFSEFLSLPNVSGNNSVLPVYGGQCNFGTQFEIDELEDAMEKQGVPYTHCLCDKGYHDKRCGVACDACWKPTGEWKYVTFIKH